MPYILSPEQKVVVDALASKTTSSTKYFDINTAMQALCKACTAMLNNGRKILIHMPDADMRDLLAKYFSENGLEDLTIDLSNKNFMPEVDIIKLRSSVKKQMDTDAIIKHVISTKRTAAHKDQIDRFYEAFDSKVMSDASFRDFVTNYIYQQKGAFPITIDNKACQFQFSANEYYRVKKEIHTATQLYQRQYDLFDHLSLFKADLWNGITPTRTIEIKKQLVEFKVESESLYQEFVSVSKSLTKSSSAELKKTIAQLEEKFFQHEESCIAFHIKSTADKEVKKNNFSLFKKKNAQSTNKVYIEAFDELSSLIQSISKEWFDELDSPTSEMITYEYIIDFIEKNKAKTNSYKGIKIDNINHAIQRINKINTTSQEVKSLDKKLNDLVQKMNTSHLFDLDLEHNILSFVKQAELCKNIAEYIEKCNVLVNASSSYLEWKSFYNTTSDIFRHIFGEIKKLPKKGWIDTFENWYKYQIQNHVLGDKSISAQDMQDYYLEANIACTTEVSATIAQLHNQRIKSVENLKVTTKELYNTLFKKKQLPNISWTNIALMNRPFMQSFFPIHISDSISYAKEYDLVISFTSNDTSDESNIHYFSPIEGKDIQNMSENRNNFLYLNDYQYNRVLRELSSTDKLKASKKLAKYILSLNQNIKIYQLKNANIISLLPGHDDTYFEYELDKINTKVIDTNGVLYDRLTESILFTERNPFLIIKDELINCELHDHALWQLKLIQLFKDVGYEVFSINTTDQLVDNRAQFDVLLEKIKGPETEGDNHEELATESINLSEKV